MGSRSLILIFFAVTVMLAAILVSSSGPTAPNGTGPAVFCANPTPNNNAGCLNLSQGTSYYCSSTLAGGLFSSFFQACKILPFCNAPPYPAPIYCIGDPVSALAVGCLGYLTAGASACGVYLPVGSFAFLPSTQIDSSLSSSAAFFSFASSGASGFIGMIGVAVGLISLLGITALGSGESTEGLHILFMGGMVMGVWLILSGVEGFPGGSDVFFSSLNNAIAGAGTFIYAMLTLCMVGGFMGLVSRGS